MNASKTLLIVTPLVIILILWVSSGQDVQQADPKEAIAADVSEVTAENTLDASSVKALDALESAESNPHQLQELHRVQSALLTQAWAEWNRIVKQTSDTVGAISLVKLTTFANIVERLPPEHSDVQQAGENSRDDAGEDSFQTEAIIEQIFHLKGLIREVEELEQSYRAMILAKTAMNVQRDSWLSQATQHQFDFSKAQKLKLEQTKQTTLQHIEAEDFASATIGYKELESLYQGDAEAIGLIIAARAKAIAAQQKWQTLAARILGHKIDTKGVESSFYGARKLAQQGDYPSSVEQYEYAEKGWIKSAAKGLVVIATPRVSTLPAGSFKMGDQTGRGQRDELPVQAKSVASFAMGITEVTFDQYDAYLLSTGADELNADGNWGRGNRPVINVDFNEAKDFVAWLSVQTDRKFALPTETQWEYAASFSTGRKKDDTNLTQKAHCEGCNGWGHTKTMEVAQFPANESGLFDMFGNVWEWVSDCYQPNYSSAAPAQCDTRVARGGSWGDLPTDLRASNRSPVKFSEKSNQLGFRLVENF